MALCQTQLGTSYQSGRYDQNRKNKIVIKKNRINKIVILPRAGNGKRLPLVTIIK